MTYHASVRISALAIAVALVLPACTSEDVDSDTDVDEIIGGNPVSTAAYDAVGTIAIDGEPSCTGTLISATTVLTSKFCAWGFWDMSRLSFLLGPDNRAPRRTIAVKELVEADHLDGGFMGHAAGLAVMHLAEPVTDVTPFAYRELRDHQVGGRFTALAFGQRDATGLDGTRRAGSMMLRGTRGRAYEAMFRSLEGFLAEGARELYGDVDLTDPSHVEYLQQEYEQRRLADGYEAAFGGADGDAQPCRNDLGGPILGRENGRTYVYGIIQWYFLKENDPLCARVGIIASTIGPESRALLDHEMACPGIPQAGTCEDAFTILRCATPAEGGYRQLRTDCGALGLACGDDETGELGCIDDPCEGVSDVGTCDGNNNLVRCVTEQRIERFFRHVYQENCAWSASTCVMDGEAGSCVFDPAAYCTHDVCTQGEPLMGECGSCEAEVCERDSWCCQGFWDVTCVQKAQIYCDVDCSAE